MAHRCHRCGSAHLRRSRRRNFVEGAILPLFLVRPYRCTKCQTRQYGIGFHRLRRGLSNTLLALLLLVGVLASIASVIYLFVLLATRT